MTYTILLIVCGVIIIFLLETLRIERKRRKGLENSIQHHKKLHKTEISRLENLMKEGFDIKSKALENSEELRMGTESKLDDLNIHFKQLERDLTVSHKNYGYLIKMKQKIETEFIQLREHYDAIIQSVKLQKDFILKKSNIERKLKNAG